MNLPLLALSFLAPSRRRLSPLRRLGGAPIRFDDSRATPASERNDGVDYAPTPKFYLFAQHFSAIAAAGPIAGPILACQVWGWAPVPAVDRARRRADRRGARLQWR